VNGIATKVYVYSSLTDDRIKCNISTYFTSGIKKYKLEVKKGKGYITYVVYQDMKDVEEAEKEAIIKIAKHFKKHHLFCPSLYGAFCRGIKPT